MARSKNKMKTKKKLNFNRALVIGPSGIGNAHIRQYAKNKISKIAILGKSFKKKRTFQLANSTLKKAEIINLKNFNEVKKIKPQIISICSPTKFHLKHLLKLKNSKSAFIVEKPFFWLNRIGEKNLLRQTNFFLKTFKKKIIINLPMVSLANQLKNKKLIIRNITKLKFCYFTRGKNQYNKIAIDLLPHAVSFCLSLLKSPLKDFKIIFVKKKRFSWSTKIIINRVHCYFLFKQDQRKKESRLSFKINELFFTRIQKKTLDEYKTYLILKNKKIFIKNPMSDSLNNSIIFLKNQKHNKFNHHLVVSIMKLTYNLVNWKKN